MAMMRLGWALGQTVPQLLANGLSLDDLMDWLAFERLSGPIGPERGDLQAAQTPAMVASMFRSKGERPISPVDLCPKWGEPAKPAGMSKRAWAAWFRKRLAEEGS